MAVTFDVYLDKPVGPGGSKVPIVGQWVKYVSNSTSTAYVSSAVTDSQGKATLTVPGGTYTSFYGSDPNPAASTWLPTGDTFILVPDIGSGGTVTVPNDLGSDFSIVPVSAGATAAGLQIGIRGSDGTITTALQLDVAHTGEGYFAGISQDHQLVISGYNVPGAIILNATNLGLFGNSVVIGRGSALFAGYSPTHDIEFIDVATHVDGYINDGVLAMSQQLYPGSAAAADTIQTASGILACSGIPSNAVGNNGDWAPSDNGHLYFKTAGAWVQKV